MPELPEVETTKQGIKPYLEGQLIKDVIVRNHSFRLPIPLNINELCQGKSIIAVERRAKYLLLHLTQGHLLIHLGMSGHLRILPEPHPAKAHEHVDLQLENGTALRFYDPRRFGLFIYLAEDPYQHTLLAHLGPEPLSLDFNAEYLFAKTRNKVQAIKSLIMNNAFVVGVGNIYATESLYFAKIHPKTPAKHITLAQYQDLVQHIKDILHKAIHAGGTTLRDFYAFDGKPGYFTQSLQVYGRQQKPCFACQQLIGALIIGGRTSTFCPGCQPLL